MLTRKNDNIPLGGRFVSVIITDTGQWNPEVRLDTPLVSVKLSEGPGSHTGLAHHDGGHVGAVG